MKSCMLGFMNFSVISRGGGEYKEKKKSYENYKSSILDPERLKVRERIFFDNTVPLFVSQHNKLMEEGVFFKFCIAVSDQLPRKLMQRFDALVCEYGDVFSLYKVSEDSRHSWLDTLQCQVEAVADRNTHGNRRELIVSNFRLDDDDLLSKEYFSRQVKYLDSCYEGFYVTFPKGYVGLFDDGYEAFYDVSRPFLAIGLSKISKFDTSEKRFLTERPCIFAAGGHSRLINDSVSILDSSILAYIWTVHAYSDTRSVDLNREKAKLKIKRFISDQNLKAADFGEVSDIFDLRC